MGSEHRISVAVVGAGKVGSAHARIIAASDRCQLVAVADPRLQQLQPCAELGAMTFTSSSEMLERCSPALVVVAAPTAVHEAVAVDALSAGCAVLVEKPLAIDGRAAHVIRVAAEASSHPVFVGHVERFHVAVDWLRSWLRTERASVRSIAIRRGGPPTEAAVAQGALADLGSHEIDLYRYLWEGRADALRAAPLGSDDLTLDAHLRGSVLEDVPWRCHVSHGWRQQIQDVDIATTWGSVHVDMKNFEVTTHRGRAPARLSLDEHGRDRLTRQLHAVVDTLTGPRRRIDGRLCSVAEGEHVVCLIDQLRDRRATTPPEPERTAS